MEQVYESEVNNEYVIRGNSVVMKCSIPSFVSDFVSVVSWEDEKGMIFASDSDYGIFEETHNETPLSSNLIFPSTAHCPISALAFNLNIFVSGKPVLRS